MKTLRLPLAAVTFAAFITGCATTDGGALVDARFDPEGSRAYNLAQAAGLHQVKDTELGEHDYHAVNLGVQNAISDTLLFNSNAGLGMSMGSSIGLGVLGMLTASPGPTQRDSLFGWVSTQNADTPELAREFVLNSFYDAATSALDDLAIEYTVRNERGRYQRSDRTGVEIFITDEELGCPDIDTVNSASEVCAVVASMALPRDRPTNAPEVSGVSGPAYWFQAQNDRRYIRYIVPQPKGTSVPKEAITSALTRNLPEGLFVYLAPSDDRPSMVLDQGEPQLFIRQRR